MANNQTSELLVFTQEDWRVLDSLEVRNLGALEGLTDEMSKQIIRELTDGLNAGEGMSELSARIQDATGMAELRATTIARTETINAAVDGARTRYEQAGVTEFEYIAASDERTCGECARHNGKIYKLTDNANMPPLHPNCRCAIAPIIGDRKEEILEAEKKRAEEEAKKARREAELKKKQEEEAQKLKEIQAEQKKKAKEELKKAKEELKKAREEKEAAEAAIKEIEKKEAASEPLLTLARGGKQKPVIPYTDFKKIGTPPKVVKEPENISRALEIYTGNGYNSINSYLRQKKGWEDKLGKRTLEQLIEIIKEADINLSDKVIAPKIEMQNGMIVTIEDIFRGLSGTPAEEVVDAFLKYGADNINGIELSPDEGIQSWSIDEEVAVEFATSNMVVRNGQVYYVALQEAVEEGTHGFFVGKASTNRHESEVLRARGLTNVMEHISPAKLPDNSILLTVISHLKRRG